jgi:hypothetical protein
VDRKVIRPNIDPDWSPPSSGYLGVQTPAAWAEIKVGQRDPTSPESPQIDAFPPDPFVAGGVGFPWSGKRSFNAATNSYAPDFERDLSGLIVGRAPVDLNWARNKPPVLRALLKDLAGVWLDTSSRVSSPVGVPSGMHREEGFVGIFRRVSLSPADLNAAAGALQIHTGFPTWTSDYPDWDKTSSFDSWDEFNRFVDLKLTVLTAPQRDLLKANFNPNTASNKFNPGETTYKSLDKSDLTRYSTEFCFRSPALTLAAAGRLVDAGGRLLAERTLSVTARFRQMRLTTQSEFCAGNLGDLDVAGDEGAFRLPGASGFLEPSDGPDQTHGSRFPGCPHGLCLQTYPEPQWPQVPGGSRCPGPAPYDGSLQLATLDTDAATPGTTFLAPYDNGYDALPDYPPGNPVCLLDERHGSQAISLLGRGPVGPQAVLNQIYPDGCYSEAYREPGYEALRNIGDGVQGMLSMWYRPLHDYKVLDIHNRDAMPFKLNREDLDPSTNPGAIPLLHNSQVLLMGVKPAGVSGRLCWGVFAENRVAMDDDRIEDGAIFGWWGNSPSPRTFQHAHRWMLLTAQWNIQAVGSAGYTFFAVNGTSYLTTPLQHYVGGLLPISPPDGGLTPPCSLTDSTYREDGSYGTPFFYLGGDRGVSVSGAPADGTVDELLCLTRTTDMNEAAGFAPIRFSAGRYYKEDEPSDPYGLSPSEWTSAQVALGAGARLLRVDWTLLLPREYQAPSSYPDLWPPPNRVIYGTGVDRVAGETADMAFMPRDPSGAALLPAPLAGRSGAMARLSLPGGTLKLGIDIRPRLGDNPPGAWHKLSAPLLESPVLDDLTLTYTGPEGPRLGSWREGD